MRQPVKLALIGGEVTLLAAFTGVGIHLAMQPHRVAFRPPALTLPVQAPPALPILSTPLLPPQPSTTPPAAATPFLPALFSKFGEQDRNLVIQQWGILQGLTSAVERYVEKRIAEEFAHHR
jgi:hypothetical protein